MSDPQLRHAAEAVKPLAFSAETFGQDLYPIS
jgi:hypothetical protein